MAPRNRSNLDNVVARVSARHGLPLSFMRTFGMIESGMRPSERTGSYKGLYQLSDDVFRRHGGRGSIYNAEENAEAFARLTLVNAAKYRATTGRNPTGEELYLMHQQGAAGAMAHKRAPNKAAWENVRRYYPNDAVAKKAIWGNMSKQWKSRFGRVENVTSGDFMEAWGRQFRAKEQWASGTTTASTATENPKIPSQRRADLDKVDRYKNFRMAQNNLRLNKRETRLYERHLKNLWGDGGVSGGVEGSRATLLTATIEEDGRHYVIPTVWDGKVLSVDEAVKRARKEGLRRFPAYSSDRKAQARYNAMHEFMDMDGEAWVSATQTASAPVPVRGERKSIPDDWTNMAQTAEMSGQSELDSVSAENAAAEMPPAPPTFAAVYGGKTEPEPYKVPTIPGAAVAALGVRRKKKDEEEFFTPERLESTFGKEFGQLYEKPEPELPPAPKLLRDLFRAA